MDFNADLHFKKVLREFCDKWRNTTKIEYGYWKHITTQIIRNKGIMDAINMVLACAEELSDKEFIYIFYTKEPVIEKIKSNVKKGTGEFMDKINEKISIIDKAKQYGLKLRGNKCICPFHDDTNPSLIFYPKTNTFHCFGCHAHGNLIDFVAQCKLNGLEKKNG